MAYAYAYASVHWTGIYACACYMYEGGENIDTDPIEGEVFGASHYLV